MKTLDFRFAVLFESSNYCIDEYEKMEIISWDPCRVYYFP